MGAVEEMQNTRADAWIGHVVGGGIGAAAAAAVVGLTWWEGRLRDLSVREASAEPIWVLVGLYVLAGVATVVAVLLSPRMPWLPTVAAVALGYYLLASLPSSLASFLPYPGSVPRLQWGFTTAALLTGVMSATAVWSWWSHLSRTEQRSPRS